MDRLTFSKLALLGLLLSMLGATAIFGLKYIFFNSAPIYLAIFFTIFIYQSYLILQSQHKTGLLAFGAFFWFSNIALLLMLDTPIHSIACSLFLLWLTRCIYLHQRFITMLADATITLIATISAYWVLINTTSWFLTLWSFYLIQAFMVFLPPFASTASANFRANRNANAASLNNDTYQHFELAHDQAESALNKLSSQPNLGV